MSQVYAGVDIGGTGTTVGLYGEDRRLLAKRAFATLGEQRQRFGDPVALADRLAEEILGAVDSVGNGSRLAAAGIGVPGQVDPERGFVHEASNLGWRDAPLASLLESRLQAKIRIDHDVRAFVWGETIAGAARGCRNVVGVTIGTGIAAGIVLDGRLVRGSHCLAGEIGHDSVAGLDGACVCGKIGCLETVVSAPGIARLAEEAGLGAASGGRKLTAADVTELGATGRPEALRIYQYAAGLLAGKLETVVALLDPDMIVIGGGVAEAGELLLAPLRQRLQAQFPWLQGKLRVAKGELGGEASLIGALHRVYPGTEEDGGGYL